MWFDVHWSVLSFHVIVTSVRLVSCASLSRGGAWRFGALIRTPSSFELGCFLYFAPHFLVQKDALHPWWHLVCTLGECLCLYKYLLSSSPYFCLLKFLLVVKERSCLEGSREMVARWFYALSIPFITGMPSLLSPPLCVYCMLFTVECGWTMAVLVPFHHAFMFLYDSGGSF